MAEPFIENLEDPEVAKSREKYYQIDCRTAGEEADKVILGADAEQADEAIELGVEAVLVAGGEEANKVILGADAEQADKAAELADETVLEAGADQADEAIELAVEDILEAGADQADEAIEVRLEAKEFFRIKAASTHSRVFRPSGRAPGAAEVVECSR